MASLGLIEWVYQLEKHVLYGLTAQGLPNKVLVKVARTSAFSDADEEPRNAKSLVVYPCRAFVDVVLAGSIREPLARVYASLR